MKSSLGCEKLTADGMKDVSKQDQLYTGSFHGSTSEEHETYFSESMMDGGSIGKNQLTTRGRRRLYYIR